MSDQNRRYHVVICGDNIGGLITASILAKRGVSLCILDTNAESDLLFGKDIIYTSTQTAPTLEKGGFFNIFRSMGVFQSKMESTDDLYQLIRDKSRLTVYNDQSKLSREFARELGMTKDTFSQMLRASTDVSATLFSTIKNEDTLFLPATFLDKMIHNVKQKKDHSLYKNMAAKLSKDELSSAFKNDDVISAFKSIHDHVSYVHYDSLDPIDVAVLFSTSSELSLPSHLFVSELRRLLKHHLAERFGIEFIVPGMLTCNRKGRHVESLVDQSQNVSFTADRFIINYWIEDTFLESISNVRYKNLKYCLVRVPFVFKVRRNCLPACMKNQLLITRHDPDYDGNIHVAVKESALKDHVLLYVTLFNNYDDELHLDRYMELKEVAIRALRSINPYLVEGITFSMPDKNKALAEDFLSRHMLDDYNYIFKSTAGRGLRRLSGSPFKTKLKNLFLSGRGIFPGLGGLGEVYSGLHLAKYILRDK